MSFVTTSVVHCTITGGRTGQHLRVIGFLKRVPFFGVSLYIDISAYEVCVSSYDGSYAVEMITLAALKLPY